MGYYPQDGGLGNVVGPGEIRTTDSSQEPDRSSGFFAISIDQVMAIRQFANHADSGSYWLLGDDPFSSTNNSWNCATWVRDAIRSANVNVKIPAPTFLPWWQTNASDSYRDQWSAEGWLENGIWPGPDAKAVNEPWQAARTPPPPRRDPLAIDLDGDGIETLGASPESGTPVLFDHDGDGLKTGTGWLTGDDAWLVRDLDGNGNIDSGRELFGVDTVIEAYTYWSGGGYTFGTRNAYSGFEALAVLDIGSGTFGSAGYLDGVFDARDAAFDELLLWRDLDGDGTSDAGELASLSANGIVSISLQSDEVVQDLGDGNRITGSAVVTRSGGSQTDVSGVDLTAGNLDLGENPFYREFPDIVPWTEAAAALPEMGGSGWLRDLREAMSLGTTAAEELTRQVQAFAASGTRDDQLTLLDSVLQAWAATSGRFKPWPVAEGMAMERVTRELLFTDGSTETVRYVAADPGVTSPLLVHYEFRDLSMMSIGSTNGSSPADAVNVIGAEWMLRRNVLEAFNGQRFFGFEAEESVGGGSGDGSGGGGGGGGSSDPNAARVRWYITIENTQRDAVNSAYDALKSSLYQALVLQTRLGVYLDAIDVVFDEGGVRFDTGEMRSLLEVRLADSPQHGLEDLVELTQHAASTLGAVKFDSVSWIRDILEPLPSDHALRAIARSMEVQLGATLSATASSDIWLGDAAASNVDGEGGSDTLSAADGNDTVYGGEGDDWLFGGNGKDSLYGESGSDVIEGEGGDDYLRGGGDNDVYRWGRGSGDDQIDEQVSSNSGTDRVEISGLTQEDLIVRRSSGGDLVLTCRSTGEVLTVVDGFQEGYEYKWVESVFFEVGAAWDIAVLRSLSLKGSADADALYGHATDDSIVGAGGNDLVYGHDGNDTLDGDDGDDDLDGGNGNDILLGGAGKDYLYGQAGDDTLDGGSGSTVDYLRGSSGNDIYRWAQGQGNDQIDEQASSGSGTDRIELSGLNASAVVVSRNSVDDLLLKISTSGETLTVTDGFREGYDYKWIESVVFADGTSWSLAQMREMVGSTSTNGGSTVSAGQGSGDLQGLLVDAMAAFDVGAMTVGLDETLRHAPWRPADFAASVV